MNQISTHYSDALVDYSGLSKTLGGLQHSFSLLEFLDLCAILEGIVLHDRLLVVGGGPQVSESFRSNEPQIRTPSSPGTTAVPHNPNIERWNNLMKPLVEAGVLVAAPRTRPEDPGPKPAYEATGSVLSAQAPFRGRLTGSLARSTKLDSWFEAGRLLGAERELGCAPLALIRQRPFYEEGGQAKPRHTVCDLMGRYRDLATALVDLRTRTRLSMAPFLVLPIPPLPLIVLRLCSTYDQIIPRALDVRENYSDLRTSLRSLRTDLADDTLSPKKKLAVIRSWQRAWMTLRDYTEQSTYVEIASNALDIPDLNSAIEGIDINSIRLSDLLKVAIERTVHAFYSWRVRLLHGVARRYLATTDSQLSQQVERLFNTQVSADQLDVLQAHWGSLGSEKVKTTVSQHPLPAG